jgi:hypothetical protein
MRTCRHFKEITALVWAQDLRERHLLTLAASLFAQKLAFQKYDVPIPL